MLNFIQKEIVILIKNMVKRGSIKQIWKKEVEQDLITQEEYLEDIDFDEMMMQQKL